MAKIYETIEDARRDDLALKAREAKTSATNAGNNLWWGGSVGLLALQLDHTKEKIKPLITIKMPIEKPKFLEKLGNTRFFKAYEKFSDLHAFKVIAGLGALFMFIEGLIYFQDKKVQKNAERELAQLGPLEEIIKLSHDGEVVLPRDAETVQKFIPDVPAIAHAAEQPSTAHVQTGKEIYSERLEQIPDQQKNL